MKFLPLAILLSSCQSSLVSVRVPNGAMGEPSTRGAKFARHETKGTEYRAKLAREFEKMVFSKEPSADDRAAAWLERENARILNKENEP